MAASVGIEPTTITLTACSSTNWAMRQRNPPSQYRTDDFLFFKQALYQLSYRGKTEKVGFEPTADVKPLFLSRKVPLATRPLLHSENGGIWTPECSVAQTELLSSYNSFSRLQLLKYSYKWVELESNQQRFKLLFYRQLPTPVGGPNQKFWKCWRELNPQSLGWKPSGLNHLPTALKSWHRDWDLNSENQFWRLRCCQLHHPCIW